MNTFPIKDILLLSKVISKEAPMLFPDNENSRLQYCAAKGMLAFATKMAHYLRTAKDQNGNLIFPDSVAKYHKKPLMHSNNVP